jgi:hypothetical protein
VEGEPEIALGVLLIGARPQQILDDLSPMLLTGSIGQESKEQRSLLAREVDIPALGMSQAKPSKQCDLECCHG